jgi:hypothetical protein
MDPNHEKIITRLRDARERPLSPGGVPAPVAVGALVFAGAFSFGVEQAGYEVAGHLELPDLALGITPARTSRSTWTSPASSRARACRRTSCT